MKEKKEIEKNKKSMKHLREDFDGYTLHELRFQLAILELKKDLLKEKIGTSAMALKSNLTFGGNKASGSNRFSNSIWSKITKGLDYADYIAIGFSVFRIGKKLISKFKRKK